MKTRFASLAALLPILVLFASNVACVGLLKYHPPTATGSNPLKGRALKAEMTSLAYPDYRCQPGRMPTTYTLSANGKQVCLDTTLTMLNPTPPRPDPTSTLTVQNAAGDTRVVPQVVSGFPAEVATCSGNSGTVRQWAWTQRGCVANSGFLVPSTSHVTLVNPRDAAKPYAVWNFQESVATAPSR